MMEMIKVQSLKRIAKKRSLAWGSPRHQYLAWEWKKKIEKNNTITKKKSLTYTYIITIMNCSYNYYCMMLICSSSTDWYLASRSFCFIISFLPFFHQILVILSFFSCQDLVVEIPTILLFVIEPYPFRLRQAQGHGRQHKQDDQEILHDFCRSSASRTLLRHQLRI